MWLLALVAGHRCGRHADPGHHPAGRAVIGRTRAADGDRVLQRSGLHGDDDAGGGADPRRRPAGDVAGGRVLGASSRRASVGRFEPSPGVLVQWQVLLPVVLASWWSCSCYCTGACWRSPARRAAPSSSSPVVDAVASRSPVLPAAIGIRLGFTPARGERGIVAGGVGGRDVHGRRAGRGDHVRGQPRPADRRAVPLRIERGRQHRRQRRRTDRTTSWRRRSSPIPTSSR